MSSGFLALNPDGFVKITEASRVIPVTLTSQVQFYYQSSVGESYAFFLDNPNNLLLRPPYNLYINTDPRNWGAATTGSSSATIYGINIDPHPLSNYSNAIWLSGSHGLRVNKSATEIAYDSRVAVFNIDSVIQHTIANATADIYFPTPKFGKRFVLFPLSHIYSIAVGDRYTPDDEVRYEWALISETHMRLRPKRFYGATNWPKSDMRGKVVQIISGYYRYG